MTALDRSDPRAAGTVDQASEPDIQSSGHRREASLQDRRQCPVVPVDTAHHGYPTIVTGGSTPSSADLRLNTGVSSSHSNLAKELEFGNYDPGTGHADHGHRSAMAHEGMPARTSSVKSLTASYRSLSPGSAASSPGIGPLADITPLPSPIGSQSGSWINMPPAAIHAPSPYSSPGHVPQPSPHSGNFASGSPTGAKRYQGADQAHLEQARSSLDASRSKPRSYSNRSFSDHASSVAIPPRVKSIVTSNALSPPEITSPLIREEHVAAQRGITSVPVKPPTPPKSNISATDSSESDSLLVNVKSKNIPLHYEARTVRSDQLQKWIGIRQLGVGTFSTVMLATSDTLAAGRSEEQLDPKTLVAVKICEHGPAGGADEKKIQSSLKRELEILKTIHHPSLVHLRAMNMLERKSYLVLDYSAGGDLFELASLKLSLVVPSLIGRIFAELVEAVTYLHENYIVHRDIKLENVLVNPRLEILPSLDYTTYPHPIITLTDLGLGRVIPRPPESPMLNTRCGSEDYAAPELLMGQEYDGRQTDTWALGVLLYSLMEGRLPFDPIPGARRQSPTTHRIARCEWQWIRWGDRDGDWDAGVWAADHRRGGPTSMTSTPPTTSTNGHRIANTSTINALPEREDFLRWGQELEGAHGIVDGLLKKVNRRWALATVRQKDWVKDAMRVNGGLRRHAWIEE